MRSGIVFTIGVAMMAVALTAVVGTVTWVNRMEDEPTIAQEPVAAPTPTPAPAKATPSEPVEDPRDKIPKIPKKESAETSEQKSVEVPRREPAKTAPSRVASHEEKAEKAASPLTGANPAADTATSVAVKTCGGNAIKLNAAEKRMFDLHNKTRVERGLGALCVSPYLTKLSRSRSQDMLNRNYFSHYTPEGTSVTDMVKRSGNLNEYVQVGENISKGGDGTDTDLPGHMFAGLMDSPGHRENILRKGFDEIGVGAVSGIYEPYDDVSTTYTMVFGAAN